MALRASSIISSACEQYKATNAHVIHVESAPGVGKSSIGRDIAKIVLGWHGLDAIQYDSGHPESAEFATMVEFNGALRDPTDVLGLPHNAGKFSYWTPPAEFYALRHGSGPKFLLVEELTDSLMPMQNALCRVFLDRYAGNLRLTDQLYIFSTGNRTEDRSGAQRMVTKLGNRLRKLEMEFNLDDFLDWGERTNKIPRLQRDFHRFRPRLCMDFNPLNVVNPTPRSWERVATIPTTMTDMEYYEHTKGEVGEGAAAEWIGFRRIASTLMTPEEVLLRPTTTPIPSEPAALFAMTGAMSEATTKENIERVAQYIERMPKEFQLMYFLDTQKKTPAVKMTKTFINWATRNANVMLG
jgi:hypothetical protein